PKRLLMQAEPQASATLTRNVEELLNGAGIALKVPGARMELPDDAGFPGAPNPVVVVGLNVNGQLFFQHQLISEALLEERLASAVSRAGNERLTLLLQADKNVPMGKVTRLGEIARRAHIAELRIATKPP